MPTNSTALVARRPRTPPAGLIGYRFASRVYLDIKEESTFQGHMSAVS